jgi:hypothetical protein
MRGSNLDYAMTDSVNFERKSNNGDRQERYEINGFVIQNSAFANIDGEDYIMYKIKFVGERVV